jgi:hypothetical protein
MFYEYALDPLVLSSWERVRFFLDAFGPWKGRFLAEYPKRWKKIVYDGLNCRGVEKTRIEERLRRLDKRVFSSRQGSSFDSNKPWLDNALQEHHRESFQAIIAESTLGNPVVLDAGAIDDEDPLWRVDSGKLIARDPQLYTKALSLLLLASSHIVLIDPYFRADQDEKLKALVAFCNLLRSRTVTLEVHFSDGACSYSYCMDAAARVLPKQLPKDFKVKLKCWREKLNGPRLHNRYLLTNIGGIKFGDGIEEGNPGQEDHLSILDEPSREALWNQYIGASPAFDAAGTPRDFSGVP